MPAPVLGMPQYFGNGCPQGSVSAALSPDNSTISVLFDKFILDVQALKRMYMPSQCQLSIPLQIPAGLKVALMQLDYRGFISVPENSNVSFLSLAQFADNKGRMSFAQTILEVIPFMGPFDGEIGIQGKAKQKIYTDCGGSFKLVSTLTIRAQSNAKGEQIFASIDSLDVSSKPVTYRLAWSRCR